MSHAIRQGGIEKDYGIMIRVNENFLKLRAGYLFPEIGRRVRTFKQEHPQAKVISMGIGDVTQPLAPAVIEAMHKAVDEMGRQETFRGYEDSGVGYEFLRKAIVDNDFGSRGVSIDLDEVFVSDGAKSDTGNMQEIFGIDNVVAVADPVYPVYVDTNVMAGRTGPAGDEGQYAGIVYMPATAENGFVPAPPDRAVDMVYLCFPNNPTGSVATKDELAKWVEYARSHKAVIFFDAAYEAYISDPAIPHSIYEIEGAKEVAIEFRSCSKTAGFTGVRCAYSIVPEAAQGLYPGRQAGGRQSDLEASALHEIQRRLLHHAGGRRRDLLARRARSRSSRRSTSTWPTRPRFARASTKLGYKVYGGVNAPYIWVRTPKGVGSWQFFDRLLNEVQRRLHAGRRVRAGGRRLRASDGLRPARERQRGPGPTRRSCEV